MPIIWKILKIDGFTNLEFFLVLYKFLEKLRRNFLLHKFSRTNGTAFRGTYEEKKGLKFMLLSYLLLE